MTATEASFGGGCWADCGKAVHLFPNAQSDTRLEGGNFLLLTHSGQFVCLRESEHLKSANHANFQEKLGRELIKGVSLS